MSYHNTSSVCCADFEMWTELFQKTPIQRPEWIRTVYVVIMTLIFIAGVTGNLITCIVIYFDKTMHTATNFYLFNLAVSDILVAFGIVLDLNEYMKKEHIIVLDNDGLVCKIHFFLVVALWNNGVLTMTALAIERYIAILHPMMLNSKLVYPRVIKNIVLIWMIALLETVPEVWTFNLTKTPAYSVCVVVPSTFARWLNGVLGVFNFVIPLTIMTFVYTTIAFKVNKTSPNNRRDKIFNHGNPSKKVNKLIVALTLSFVGCWLPFFTMRIIIFTTDLHHWSWYLENWDLIGMTCSFNWFSIVLNPMLFSLMSTKFRKALKMQWKMRFMKQSEKIRSDAECLQNKDVLIRINHVT